MTNYISNGDTIEIDCYTFRVEFSQEDCPDFPWENSDCHGPVRKSTRHHIDGRSDKAPGERPLNSPDRNEYQFYYDWAEACRIAKRDVWNTQPFDAPNKVQRAVQADYDYLRRYLSGDWQYVFITVTCEETGDSDSIGMVETYNDYHCDMARDMAKDLAISIAGENKEADYWRQRDLDTMSTNNRTY